jgi:ABC-type sugar transport system ATPase subunit
VTDHDDLESALAELIARAWGRDAEEELLRLGIDQHRAIEIARARRGAPTVLEIVALDEAVVMARRER